MNSVDLVAETAHAPIPLYHMLYFPINCLKFCLIFSHIINEGRSQVRILSPHPQVPTANHFCVILVLQNMTTENVALEGRIFQEEETAHVKAQGMRRVSGITNCSIFLTLPDEVEDRKSWAKFVKVNESDIPSNRKKHEQKHSRDIFFHFSGG